MRVTVQPADRYPDRYDLLIYRPEADGLETGQVFPRLTEHDLRDIVFVLEQRRAMSSRCEASRGEHTCALRPGHPLGTHQCRACTRQWAPGQRGNE